MKKIFAGILVIGLALSVSGTAAFAAAPRCGRYFVDADGDGICDNYTSGQSRCGRYFVDADGDGVCDNYNTSGQGRGGGYGCGSRCGHGNGFRCGRGR